MNSDFKLWVVNVECVNLVDEASVNMCACNSVPRHSIIQNDGMFFRYGLDTIIQDFLSFNLTIQLVKFSENSVDVIAKKLLQG